MKRTIIILLLAVAGCGTTTVVERVEVPVLVEAKVENIKELPPRYELRSKQITREQAEGDPRDAFRRLGEDVAGLIAENEEIRDLYNALVKRVQKTPEEAP